MFVTFRPDPAPGKREEVIVVQAADVRFVRFDDDAEGQMRALLWLRACVRPHTANSTKSAEAPYVLTGERAEELVTTLAEAGQ